MRQYPTGDQLLELARRALKEEILPKLSQPDRDAALMTINAMGIAARQLASGDEAERSELEGLQILLGHPLESSARPTDTLESRLHRLNSQLARLIRKGGADPDAQRHQAIRAHLWATTTSALYESNPKYPG